MRESHLKQLRPFLVGEAPRERNGEWDMYCPLHEDKRRSASLNVKTGEWWCFACNTGGRAIDLIKRKAEWVNPASMNGSQPARSNGGGATEPLPSETKIVHWHENLIHNEENSLDWLISERGISRETVSRFRLGWDIVRHTYTIPVRDADGILMNLRRYNPRPAAGKRKIWGIGGANVPRLFPMEVLDDDPERIVISEGELDAMVTIQRGYPCITRTGAARVWKPEWNHYFAGRVVYIAQDHDKAGQIGARKIARSIRKVAKEVRIVRLPYPIEADHGKDLTDFWLEYDSDYFDKILDEAELYTAASEEPEIVTDEIETVGIVDSMDSRRVGRPSKMLLTIRGKKAPGYSVPSKARLSCSQDKGPICNVCPMFDIAGGEAEHDIEASDPTVLEMMEAPKGALKDIVRRSFGAVKCDKLTIDLTEHQAVETLYARSSVESSDGFTNLKITSVGRHDTNPNSTVAVVGALHPNPRSQMNEFLAWSLDKQETAIDRFDMTPEIDKMLKVFQPGRRQRPLAKAEEIANELAAHVTKIYGRPEMHMVMDIVWHSALAFKFKGELIDRGWTEAIIIGDTRTGKSEASRKLSRHYDAGEVVSCESSSIPGIVGGVQQFGSGREWAVTWGTIPINDRRLVVLDEVSGLTPEQISQMSDVRSRGRAIVVKIVQDEASARTRLLWLSNPRNATMAHFTYGVQALRPLIGNDEDMARFEIVCCVARDDVPAEEINRSHAVGRLVYNAEACSTLIRWVWTRTPEQVKWADGAEQAVYDAALDLGGRYVESPPLLQAANARVKVARMAIALAARLYSTDNGDNIVVTKTHVEDAVAFIDRVYGMRTMGYRDLSSDRLVSTRQAVKNVRAMRKYLSRNKPLLKFLRTNSSFRRQDLEEIMNCGREDANGMINKLWDYGMIRKEKGDILVESTLHNLLREMQ